MTTTIRGQDHPTVIPGPPGHPLLGMAPAFQRDMLGTMIDGFTRYGDLVAYRFGPRWGPRKLLRRGIGVYHPDGVRQMFTHRQIFNRRTVGFGVLAELLGEGLLTSDGDLWVRQRRTLQPLFTPRRVAGYAQLMAAEAERVAATPPGTVNLHELMQRYTLRVVGRALFGDEVDDAVVDLQRLVPSAADLSLARAMQLVRLPLGAPTSRNLRLRRFRTELHGIVDRIMARHRDAGTAGKAGNAGNPGNSDDMLSRLRAARDPETGEPLSEREVRDQVLIFLLAGHETTAGALTFTLYLLGRHPEIQDRVAAGGDELARAAVMEGMRLYPPAYSTERMAGVDTEIMGYPIPAGTLIFGSPWVTHRHPDFWPEPDRFDPGRFIGEHDRPRYAYFPFGGGPRSCIGEHFALLEATVLLRALLSRYRVESLDANLRLQPLITLRPAAPVRAVLTGR
jgi:cytochrome P450